MDYNVDNYSIIDIFAILSLINPSETDAIYKTDFFINKFNDERNYKSLLFFRNVKKKIINYFKTVANTQTEEWYKNQALPQTNNTVQNDKITDRMQKIDIYDNSHMPMKQEQLGINNNFNVPIAQDTLNPNLENVTTRLINLDSQFRQHIGGIETGSTDYTLDLSDSLTNVVSLRLYSFQIPFTWYAIDTHYGNTCFWFTNNNKTYTISVAPGNYLPQGLCDALNVSFSQCLKPDQTPPVTYNRNNGKLTILLDGLIDVDGNTISGIEPCIRETCSNFNASTNPYLTFFDITAKLTCDSGYSCSGQKNRSFNGSLGWLMGYRMPIVPIYSLLEGNIAIAMLDLYGPKYFILILDDYNQNHINNGLITITEIPNNLSMPNYYNPSMPHFCGPDSAQNYTELISIMGNNNSNDEIINDNQIEYRVGNNDPILPTAPRILTQAQIYTINEIKKNRNKTLTYRGKAPTPSDTFALIPIRRNGIALGDIYSELSGSLQDNKRIYFGPVDIDKMHIKLIDDRGHTVNLNGVEWCITLISENLYQY